MISENVLNSSSLPIQVNRGHGLGKEWWVVFDTIPEVGTIVRGTDSRVGLNLAKARVDLVFSAQVLSIKTSDFVSIRQKRKDIICLFKGRYMIYCKKFGSRPKVLYIKGVVIGEKFSG